MEKLRLNFDYSTIIVDENGNVTVNEVGCGCCGNRYQLSEEEVKELIQELKENIEQLEKNYE